MSGEPIIKVEGLHKWFGMLEVLHDISFEVKPREVVVLIGRSGSGKSTLLRCLNYLETPSAGKITVDGVSVEAVPGKRADPAQVRALRMRSGMVFQDFNLFPHMTALENAIEGLVTVKKMDKSAAVKIGEEMLAKVGLSE